MLPKEQSIDLLKNLCAKERRRKDLQEIHAELSYIQPLYVPEKLKKTGYFDSNEAIPQLDIENMAYKMLSEEKTQTLRDNVRIDFFKSSNVRISKKYFEQN